MEVMIGRSEDEARNADTEALLQSGIFYQTGLAKSELEIDRFPTPTERKCSHSGQGSSVPVSLLTASAFIHPLQLIDCTLTSNAHHFTDHCTPAGVEP
jgi:hypothetical protein